MARTQPERWPFKDPNFGKPTPEEVDQLLDRAHRYLLNNTQYLSPESLAELGQQILEHEARKQRRLGSTASTN